MIGPSSPPRIASRRAIAGWVLFDWACQPFFTLVTTFVYAPYFASVVVGDGARGQALWGFAAGTAGILVALFSPVLGAVADATGRRKPWIAAFGLLLIIGSSALWFGRPGDANTIAVVLVAFVVGSIGVEFASVFNNAMMPTLVPQSRLGRLSGLGWAMGYVGGLVSLAFTLVFLAANPQTGRTLAGFAPLFGLDASMSEGDRATGPLSALWFIVFVLPLFLFTPDGKKAMNLGPAIRVGLRNFAATLREIRHHANSVIFLLANMIYANGLGALFAFGGIYAAGSFGWTTIEIGVFGILITIAASAGALTGGWLDDKFGSKNGGPRGPRDADHDVRRNSLGRPRHRVLRVPGTASRARRRVFSRAFRSSFTSCSARSSVSRRGHCRPHRVHCSRVSRHRIRSGNSTGCSRFLESLRRLRGRLPLPP